MIAIIFDDYHRTIKMIGFGDATECKQQVNDYCQDVFYLGKYRSLEWTAMKQGRWYVEVGDDGYPVYILDNTLQAGRVGNDTVIILPRSSVEAP